MLGRLIRKAGRIVKPVLAPLFRIFWRISDGWLTGISVRRAEMVLKGRVFDAEWYIEHNKNVGDYTGGPLSDHFFRHGAYEGRKARFFDAGWYFRTHTDLRGLRIDAWTHYQKHGRKEGRSARFFNVQSVVERGLNRDYQLWRKLYDVTAERDTEKAVEAFGLKAPFDLLFVVESHHTKAQVEHALRSIRKQIYKPWRCFIGAAGPLYDGVHAVIAAFVRDDSRFVGIENSGPRDVSGTLTRLLGAGHADHVCILGPADNLDSGALFWMAHSLSMRRDGVVVFADEDRTDSRERRSAPFFKPGFNYELVLSHNFLGNFTVFRRDATSRLGEHRYATVADCRYDLVLRVFETFGAGVFIHVPRVLNHVHETESLASGPDPIRAHLGRIGRPGEVLPLEGMPGYYRVHWRLSDTPPLVSIIIPTRDRVDLLRMCLDSVLARTTYTAFEIIIVDNGSVEPATLAYFEALSDARVRVLHDPRPFNFSALNNRAVNVAGGEYVCLMNNDIEIITPAWLEEMMSFAVQPGIGCVGARLWYPDDTLQHGGVLLGFHGVAGHRHKFLERQDASYAGLAALHQSLGAVTAAVLVVKTSIYQAVGGFDETLAVAFNDVDFCLKVQALGYRNVYTPFAEMYHHESASRGAENSPHKKAREQSEIEIIKARYGDTLAEDPSYSPNLSLTSEDLSFAFPPRVPTLAALLAEWRPLGASGRSEGE